MAMAHFPATTGARGSVGRDMNHLSGTERLANRYHAMRHGQSKANVAGVIVSRIETDRSGDWGLSDLGRRQALTAAERCALPADTLAAELRERCFGDLEGTTAANYARVWQADTAGADGEGADGGRGQT